MGRIARKRARRRRLEGLAKQISSPVLSKWTTFRKENTDHTQQLFRWLSNNGFHNDSRLRLVNSPLFGRALFTSRINLRPHDCVMTIPQNLLITTSVLLKNNAAIYQKFPAQLDCLMIFLMKELFEPESFWSAYLNMLPRDFSFLPCVWTEREVMRTFRNYKLPQSLLDGILGQGTKMLATYYRIKKKVVANQNPLYSLKADLTIFDCFLWAYCTVNTRCVHLPVENINQTAFTDKVALIPFFDFFNHSPKADVNIKYSPEKGFQLYTKKPFHRFEQVYIKYHNYCNRDLFYNYGFTNINRFSVDLDDTLLLHISCQDSIPITFGDLFDWANQLETQKQPQFRKVPTYSKRLATLREIEYITIKDNLALVWPINDLERFDRAMITPELNVSVIGNADRLNEQNIDLGEFDITTLDWRLDTTMQLLARPKWDNAVNIRRLIYGEVDTTILNNNSELELNEYHRLWLHFLEWLLKRDYFLNVNNQTNLDESPTVKHLVQRLQGIQNEQVSRLIANEIGLILTVRKLFYDKLYPVEISEDDEPDEKLAE